MNLNKKSILFVAKYSDAGAVSGNNRFDDLARRYAELGEFSRVDFVTSRFKHAKKENKNSAKFFKLSGVNYRLINTPAYKKNVSILRFVSNIVFAIKLWFLLSHKKYKDTSLYYVAFPTPEAAAIAIWWASKRSIKIVLDVQDIWPEVFNLVKEKKGVYRFFYKIYQRISGYCYQKSNIIVSVSDTYIQVAKSYGAVSPMYSCFLGSSRLKLLNNSNGCKEKFEIVNNKVRVAFLGTVGASYDLFTVIDAIKIANSPNLRFELTIIGDGPSLEEVLKYASSLSVEINFLGRVPYVDAMSYLMECDIAVNSFHPKATQSIVNKHGDYALAGLPVISNQKCDEYTSLLLKYNAGLTVSCKDPNSFAEALITLGMDEKKRKLLSAGSCRMGLDEFDRDNTYPKLIKWIANSLKI